VAVAIGERKTTCFRNDSKVGDVAIQMLANVRQKTIEPIIKATGYQKP